MEVHVGISESEKIIGVFKSDWIPNVGEVIFDQTSKTHYKVENRVFGISKGYSCCPMDVTLWCKKV